MPASVPTGWPKREVSWGRGRETGPPPEAGGWCYNQKTASGEDATNGEADDMGAGCILTHAPGTTGSSISTTNENNPFLNAGYCCFKGESCTTDGRGQQKPAYGQYYPMPKREPWRPKPDLNPYGKEERKAWLPQTKASPAGYGRFEPARHESQAPENYLPQQQAECARPVQMSRGAFVTNKDFEEGPCSEREDHAPAAYRMDSYAASPRPALLKIDQPRIAQAGENTRRRFR